MSVHLTGGSCIQLPNNIFKENTTIQIKFSTDLQNPGVICGRYTPSVNGSWCIRTSPYGYLELYYMDNQKTTWKEMISMFKFSDSEKHVLTLAYGEGTIHIYVDFSKILAVPAYLLVSYPLVIGSTTLVSNEGKFDGDIRVYDFKSFDGVYLPEDLIGVEPVFKMLVTNTIKVIPETLGKPTTAGELQYLDDVDYLLVSDRENVLYGVVSDA